MRELSRRTKITHPSVINHLKALVKEELIIKEKKGIYPTFRANRDNELFRVYKKTNLILRMCQTGLIDYIYDSCMPDTIILFGSASKGEDIEESDIDLFVQAKEKKLNLVKYEKLLNRKIAFFFEENFSRLSKELKNNILNGMVLKGYIKVF
jgi:predicted nucleotidyltransferase